MTINKLSKIIMQQAEEKGFGTKADEIIVAEKIALIHSEVSESYSAYRHQNIDGKDGFHEELGDIILRVLHLAGALGIDIEKEILKKLEYNQGREWDWKNLSEKNN